MQRFRRYWWLAFILLAYVPVTILVTWPLITELRTVLPGDSTDVLVHYWNGWWVGKALASQSSPFHTNYIFFPHGISLVYHNIAWLNVVPWLILRRFFDGIVAFNLVIMVNLLLCGLAAFLLVYVVVGKRLPAFLAGIVYLSWPFRLSQLDHPNLTATYWIPLSLLFLVLTWRKWRLRYALLAGASLALVGYTRWQLLIPTGFIFLAYLAGTATQWIGSRRHWMSLFLIAGIAGALLAPPASLLVRELGSTPASGQDLLREGEEAVMQTDLLAYVTPGLDHPWWGDRIRAAYERYYSDRSEGRRFPSYIGISVLLLALAGVWRRWPKSAPWLLMAVILILLALGSVLRIGGQFLPQIPTLYKLLQPLQVVRLIRVPERFNVTLALPVAVLAAYGANSLLSQIKYRSLRLTLSAAMVGLVLVEYLAIPIPRQDVRLSPVYQQVARSVEMPAILNVPIDPQKVKRYMFAQTIHGRRLVHGKIARVPPGAYSYINGNEWLRTLRQHTELAPWLTDVSRQLDALATDGVGQIILDKSVVDAARVSRWKGYLSTRARYEDDRLAVYTTTPRAGTDFALQAELQPGIGPIQTRVSASCVKRGDPLEVDVSWGTSKAPQARYQARLALVDEAGRAVQVDESEPMAEWPTDQWPENTIVHSYTVLDTLPALRPGRYGIILSLGFTDGQGQQADAPTIRAGQVEIREESCRFDVPTELEGVSATFGDELRLLAYALERRQDQLQVTLLWRSIRRMDTNYKIFVHVFQPGTGIPVAQDDSMPHRGGLPTRFWEAGETITDHIPVSLADAPPGEYGIAIGIYDPQSMERLPLVVGDGEARPDGRLVLRGQSVTIADHDG